MNNQEANAARQAPQKTRNTQQTRGERKARQTCRSASAMRPSAHEFTFATAPLSEMEIIRHMESKARLALMFPEGADDPVTEFETIARTYREMNRTRVARFCEALADWFRQRRVRKIIPIEEGRR